MPGGRRQPMSSETVLGKGMYSVVIQASHVYVGPHKSDATYSVSLHIRELLYEPEQDLGDWFDTIVNTPTLSPLPNVNSSNDSNNKANGKPARRRGQKKRGKDEMDAMPSV